ncbi:MAG: cytochrome c-type biogenesis protein [Hyphomicrobiaceae bacterium]
MRKLLTVLVLALAFAVPVAGLAPAPAVAVEADEVLSDPALESRARHISAGLRCLVCQNQSIDDSNAPLARDLRLLVRQRLQAGDTDSQVERFLVARYGEYVLLRPPVSVRTVLLWATPVLLLLLAAGLLYGMFAARGRAETVAPAKLSSDEEARLARILGERPDKS